MSEDPSYQYDIFISYSSLDGDWVRGKLVPALRAAGLKVCIDRETFDSSTALQNIENAVASSKHTLLVLSRNWLGSEWTELESLLAQHGDPTGKRSKAVPLLLERQVLRELPLRIAILSHFDFSGRRNENEEFERLIQTLQGKVQRPQEASHDESMDRRNLQTLVQRVEEFWIRGVLRQKLADRPQLTLGVLRHPQAVARTLAESLGETERPPEFLQHEEDIFGAFQAADKSLLILGEPGSGKTTALLMLAREAISAMREDSLAPAPVVFTLSSWKDGPIKEWLVSELTAKYQVPARQGEKWIENERLLFLLDGLDEVPESRRPDCMGELRAFLTEHGLAQIAVCSRTVDYQRLAMPLQLQSAVILQPLTIEQLRTYLHSGDQNFSALEQLLVEDPVMLELASSPLMLSVMTSVFRTGAADYPQQGSLEERKSFVFDRFVEQALGRRTSNLPCEKHEFLRRLRWLARRMRIMGQTLFLVELLQPSWLFRGQLWYQTLVTFFTLVLIHLPFLILTAWSWSHGDQSAPANAEAADSGWTYSSWLNLTMVLGLYVLTWGRNLGPLALRDVQAVQSLGWSWRSAGTVTAGAALVIFVIGSGLIGILLFAFLVALFSILLTSAILWVLRIKTLQGKNNPIPAWVGMVVFTLVVMYGLWVMGSVYWQTRKDPKPSIDLGTIFYVILFFSPAVFLLSGLRWRGIETIPERPTGMWPTARNALLVGMLTATLIVASIYMIGGSGTEMASAVTFSYLVGLAAMLYFGGFALIKHLALRVVLACQKALPLRCRTLMNAAVDRALMQRAGAAYLFMHREMQEHLARQAVPERTSSDAFERFKNWSERISERFSAGIGGDWFPLAWASLMARNKVVKWTTHLLLYVLVAPLLLGTYFSIVTPDRFGPNVSTTLDWAVCILFGACAGILGGAWRYFAGGVAAGFMCNVTAPMDDSLGSKVGLMMIVPPLIFIMSTKTWGWLLDGLFSDRY